MTDYAQASAADPSWTWWMTTAAAAVRLRNLQQQQQQQHHHHHNHHHGDGSGSSDVDDEYAGPGGKRQRIGDVVNNKDEYWPFERNDGGGLLQLRHRLEPNDAASAGPLDLSVKATLTTATATTTARVVGKRAGSDGYPATTTPEKRPAAATANRGKSSKKTAAGGGASASTTAVKAATRKLLPQLMLDRHVDRSSPVSGTIIVPAGPEEPMAGARKRLPSSSPSLSSSSSLSSPPYSAPADCGGGGAQDGDPRDEEYDGGDIDPEFNVVVATDEARRQIESIPNALGPYRCRLCGVRYVDAFALARHRCRCIVHVRYTCPECDKVFQCPANLASHRRWHGTGTAVKTTGAGKNCKTGDSNAGKLVNTAPHVAAASDIVSDIAAIDVNDGDDGGNVIAAPMTSASGFKKNILQRAAAAAAAAAGNDNNNNDGDNNDNDKKCNDIAK